ncbi:nucleotide modification associated domain-containing protein [Facklamia sp. P12945]|uniref:nucleotide modification associated domain-containing protein n=1 Tax=Facklamia sp. P12945 TaxID=3421950 RepID=UPI003D16A213
MREGLEVLVTDEQGNTELFTSKQAVCDRFGIRYPTLQKYAESKEIYSSYNKKHLSGRCETNIERKKKKMGAEIKPPVKVNAPKTLGDIHADICKQLNETYVAKNHDYNNSWERNLNKYGLMAFDMRANEKMERIGVAAMGKEFKVEDEKVKDTLLDLANYCIMTYMWVTKEEDE